MRCWCARRCAACLSRGYAGRRVLEGWILCGAEPETISRAFPSAATMSGSCSRSRGQPVVHRRQPEQHRRGTIQFPGHPADRKRTQMVQGPAQLQRPEHTELARAGCRAGADAVWLEGLDFGTFAGVSNDRYLKDLPLDRALEGDVPLAWQMNGASLTPEHGFPVRVFVPGYFGTNAVKWLARIQVASGRPEGLFSTRLYNRRVVGDGLAVQDHPVRELDVNSAIVHPRGGVGTALRTARHFRVGVERGARHGRRGEHRRWRHLSTSAHCISGARSRMAAVRARRAR
jgi:hypothetical protein